MKKLKIGDTIGLVSPAFAPQPSVWKTCQEFFELRGFGVKCFGRMDEPDSRFSAPDALRAQRLQDAFEDDDVAAIVCTRGGTGSSRLLDLLDFEAIARNPKPLVGYSDITVLLIALLTRAGLPSFHGPMAVDFNAEHDLMNQENLLEVLTGRSTSIAIQSQEFSVVKDGRVHGPLFGGNLSVLESMIGTTEFQVPDGAILMLEDINEHDYRVDRSLVHLRRAGIIDRCSAVLFGKTQIPASGMGVNMRNLVCRHFQDFAGPMAFDLPFGHGERKLTFPHGVAVDLAIDAQGANMAFPELWATGAADRVIAA